MVNDKANNPAMEVDLKVIFHFFRTSWKRIVIWGIIFGIIGGAFSFLLQKEYISQARLLPELASNNSLSKLGSGLGALAGLAGIDLTQTGSTDAIRPDLYPSILQSLPFALHILQQKVFVSEYQKTMALEEYLMKKQESLFDKIFKPAPTKTISSLDPKQLSRAIEINLEKENLVKEIFSRVVSTFDRKTGIITVSVQMPDPVVAAHVTNLTIDYLKDYVTNYRTEKSRKNVEFVAKQANDAKRRYQNAENALAGYQDRNRFLMLSTAKIQEARLTGEFTLAQSIYNDLNRQYEQAKIKLEEDTPVFQAYEPARIPLKKSEPKRSIIVLVFGILGVIVGIIIQFTSNKNRIFM